MNTLHTNLTAEAVASYRTRLTETALRIARGRNDQSINVTLSTLDPLPAIDRSPRKNVACFVFKDGTVHRTTRCYRHVQLLRDTYLPPHARLVVRAALLDVSLPKSK